MIKQAEEILKKLPSEVVVFQFDFGPAMAETETITAINLVTITPAGGSPELQKSGEVASGQKVQVTFSQGRAEQAFTATAANDTLTKTAHGLTTSHAVEVLDDCSTTPLPWGLEQGEVYYPLNVTANTFQLSDCLAGTAKKLIADGDGRIFPLYVIEVSVATSTGQTLKLQGRLQVRD